MLQKQSAYNCDKKVVGGEGGDPVAGRHLVWGYLLFIRRLIEEQNDLPAHS